MAAIVDLDTGKDVRTSTNGLKVVVSIFGLRGQEEKYVEISGA